MATGNLINLILEWEDVLIAKGILPQSAEDNHDELDDVLLADDAFLSKYAQQRVNELRNKSPDMHFGSLEEISQPEYEKQVTAASETAWVIVYLYQNSSNTCKIMSSILSNLAETYQSIKFVKIQATRCIPGIFSCHKSRLS